MEGPSVEKKETNIDFLQYQKLKEEHEATHTNGHNKSRNSLVDDTIVFIDEERLRFLSEN
jgi:hypothetical protein